MSHYIYIKLGVTSWRGWRQLHPNHHSDDNTAASGTDVTGAKSCQITNNSDGDCSTSIKFTTDYDHVIAELPQTFKVNGSKVKVIA